MLRIFNSSQSIRKAEKFKIIHQNYLKTSAHIDFDEMANIHSNIFKNVKNTDRDFDELWGNIITSAIKYTLIRAEWNNLSGEEKMTTGNQRTNCHNTLLNAFISLERYMIYKNWNTEWTKQLFLQEFVQNRKREDITGQREK